MDASRVPLALLDLLGAKSLGETPRIVSDVIAPTVELLDLYALNMYELKVAGRTLDLVAGFNAMDTGDSVKVNDGEVWRLYLASVQIVAGAGETVDAAPAFRYQGQTVHLADPETAANNTRWKVWNGGTPFWLPTGSELGIVANNITGTTQGSFRCVVARFRA